MTTKGPLGFIDKYTRDEAVTKAIFEHFRNMMTVVAVVAVVAVGAVGAVGAAGAWLLRRQTTRLSDLIDHLAGFALAMMAVGLFYLAIRDAGVRMGQGGGAPMADLDALAGVYRPCFRRLINIRHLSLACRISKIALQQFAALARLDDQRLKYVQTPSAWNSDRRCMPYCFRCLVLNDADVSAPRWKREWLEPTVESCSVHHTLLETVPASIFHVSGHFDAALRAISRYREMRRFNDIRRLH